MNNAQQILGAFAVKLRSSYRKQYHFATNLTTELQVLPQGRPFQWPCTAVLHKLFKKSFMDKKTACFENKNHRV